MKTEHQQTHVQVGDREADIDQGIAPLIEQSWKANIDTMNSCEENEPGIIWIEFWTADDASRFLNIIARYEEGAGSLYNRVVRYWSTPDDNTPDRFWEYDVLLMDLNLDDTLDDDDNAVEVKHPGRPMISFPLSIRFPQSDYPMVLKRMKKDNERTERKRQRALETTGSSATGISRTRAVECN